MHATTDFELARVHAPAVAAVHRCVRTAAITLTTSLDALDLTRERVATSATPRTTTARKLNSGQDPRPLST